MSMQDPIGDMLARIRNAGKAGLLDVAMPASKMKKAIASVLKQEGFIADFFEQGEGVKRQLSLKLKYQGKETVIEGLKRVSKPSCRIYCASSEMPKIRNGMGIVVVSTPQGVMCGKAATAQKLGGELLCYVW